MYSEILASALDGQESALSAESLLSYARACRAALLSPDREETGNAARLAAEIAYDRALIWLANSIGIDVTAEDFSRPRIERCRLEGALADRGTRVESLAANRS